MKKIIFAIIALFGLTCYTAMAQQTVDGVTVSELRMERNGDYLAVDMSMDMAQLDVESNRAVLLTPRLKNGADSLDLPAVGIYGRRRYYFYVRNGISMLSGSRETSYRASKRPDNTAYHTIVPYAGWMNGASLTLHRDDYGCCNTLLAAQDALLGEHTEQIAFFPELVYVRPEATIEKRDSLEGSAFVDFVVDRTDINPTYRNNVTELGKIQAGIDSVNSDRDITITSVWLKGFASPESPYAHNTELAMGRTQAVKDYIRQLYNFREGTITTDYEPENWEGLRKYVEKSNIDNKEQILALIDSDMQPDAKEQKIKTTYPVQYRFLLQNCYPALRRTDYRIAYIIRTFTDIDEIRRILQTQPKKLSLNEFYLVAQEYEPGTEEFTNVFETAVRIFPTDPTANLNAANAAMRRYDLAAAEKYLAKAGDTPEAVYARASYAFLSGNYEQAEALFRQAKQMGVKQAVSTLEELPKRMK